METDPLKVVVFTYTNHRGETATRRVQPIEIKFAKHEPWHLTEQWLLFAFCLDRQEVRSFSLLTIKDMTPLVFPPAKPIEVLK